MPDRVGLYKYDASHFLSFCNLFCNFYNFVVFSIACQRFFRRLHGYDQPEKIIFLKIRFCIEIVSREFMQLDEKSAISEKKGK